MRLTFAAILIILLFTTLALAQRTETQCIGQDVCLRVLSQRWLTKEDLKHQDPLAAQSVGVHLRFENNSDVYVYYLTRLNSVTPVGYRLSRKVDDKRWDFLPRRSEYEFAGEGFEYLELPPKSSVAYELNDWSNPTAAGYDEEHAFSIFVKLGGGNVNDARIELITAPFRPLRKAP